MKQTKKRLTPQELFLKHAEEIGMNASDLGKTFQSKGKTVKLIGLSESKRTLLVGTLDSAFAQLYSIEVVKDRLAGAPEPVPELTEWEKRRLKFDNTYNDETKTTKPYRCVEQTDGYYTRKDGAVCTEEDIKLLYELRSLGQETKFTLEDGKVKVYGFCDSSD